DLGLFRATDDAQLLIAVRNGWILVSYNRRDFVMLHDAWLTWPATFGLSFPTHPGILVLDPTSPERFAQAIIAIAKDALGVTLEIGLHWWHHRDGWRRRIVGSGWEPMNQTLLEREQ